MFKENSKMFIFIFRWEIVPFEVESLSGLSPSWGWVPVGIESIRGWVPVGVESIRGWVPVRVESIRGWILVRIESFWGWVHSGLGPFRVGSIQGWVFRGSVEFSQWIKWTPILNSSLREGKNIEIKKEKYISRRKSRPPIKKLLLTYNMPYGQKIFL